MIRIGLVLIGLAIIAGGVVNLRWSNAHYGYLIQRQYDRYKHLEKTYRQKRLELAKRQSPSHLLDQLRKWEFPLEGWTPKDND